MRREGETYCTRRVEEEVVRRLVYRVHEGSEYAVWKRCGEQDKAVVFRVLVRMLVGFSDLGVLGSSLVSLLRRRQWRRGLRRSCVSK